MVCTCPKIQHGIQKHLSFSLNIDELKLATIFIVTVPTPIDKNNHPDFNPLMRATEMIGKILKVGDLVRGTMKFRLTDFEGTP